MKTQNHDIIPRPDPIPDECGIEPEMQRILDIDECRRSKPPDNDWMARVLAAAVLLILLAAFVILFSNWIIRWFSR